MWVRELCFNGIADFLYEDISDIAERFTCRGFSIDYNDRVFTGIYSD